MRQKNLAALFSVVLIIASVFLIFTKGLNLGVDFTGGIVIEIRPEEKVNISEFREYLQKEGESLGINEVTIQGIGADKDLLIRLSYRGQNEKERIELVEKIKNKIASHFDGSITFRKVDYVGPQIGEELIFNGSMALGLAFLGIMVYIWLRFEWQFGLGAIIALLHDVIIIMGFYSLLSLEFNITSIAAILTIIGYSINDSVVIYDRVRENLRKFRKKSLEDVLNLSINNTLSRTILTAGTTIMALLALVFFGGDAIYGLSIAVLLGVIFGTYSSIYIASPILKLIGYKRPNEYDEPQKVV